MRIAFISDIHGHYQALQAVLADIEKSKVDSLICLGDIVSSGVQPREVIELFQSINCRYIMGNNDEPLINYSLMGMLCFIDEERYHQIVWALKQLTEQHLDFIRTFQATISLEDTFGRGILCCHGVPDCNHKGIFPEIPDDKVVTYINKVPESIIVCGHTHQQSIRQIDGKQIFNPGSVGHVFKSAKGETPALRPWAEYGILDLSGTEISFDMKRVLFDIDSLRAVIAETDFPYREWWEKQYI